MSAPTLDVAGTFRGKHLLMTGVTGFVGKSFLAWMACHHPDVGRITCIVRPKARKKPVQRVQEVLQSEPLQVVRDRLGAAFDGWVAAHVDAVEGDLGKPLVGLSEADITRLMGSVDVLVNVAAQVDFTPPLNDALITNVDGALGALELARRLGVPYAHVSTCFVAGYAKGFVAEEIRPNVCPNTDFDSFDPEKEYQLAHRLVKRIMEDRDDPTMPPPRRRLRTEGEARSRALGWPNTYTYTKALAEKLIWLRAGDVPFTIVRPAIVESAWKFPLPGWSEGGNGSAGCILLAYVGQRFTPSGANNVLDLVPVDLVAKGLALSVAALLNGQHQRVAQVGTSDLAPLPMPRLVELVNVWRQKKADEPGRTALEKVWFRSTDAVADAGWSYRSLSAPALSRLASTVSGWMKSTPVAPGGPVEHAFQKARAWMEAVDRTTKGIEAVYDVYGPFIKDVDVRYKTRTILGYLDRLSPEERALYAWDLEGFDWYDYWMHQHMPGLEQWIFPEMLRKLRQGITPDAISPPPIPGDLLDLLERSVGDHGDRPFLKRVGDQREQTLTYAEVHERAALAGRRLVAAGVKPGDRVLMMIERSPEWPITYFGALYAGATAVPVDPASPPDTLARLGERSAAAAWVVSEALLRKADVAAAIPAGKGHAAETLCKDAPFGRPVELPALPALAREGDRPASILFTSGTTGVPRGVVLTHANFLAVLRGVRGVYGLGPNDRFLSILPLHHSFEFTAGLLFPLSRGASVAYPDRLGADVLGDLLADVRPTAMVGVPAVWATLARRINQDLDEIPGPIRKLFDEIAEKNGALRDLLGVNLGPWLFAPIHRGLGGDLRHLVSGGAALPESVLRDFHRWGFALTSGYGLTEAAPVLTVAPPGTRRGDTVGPALTGIDVKIFEPGADGVGEVIARGPNIMKGYLDDPEGTKRVVRGGWLHTGDLGRIDEDGNLVLVGRAKEVIVAASGENVYPDELEERLGSVEDLDEVGVLGMPDGLGGERVVAVVIPKDLGDVGNNAAEQRLRKAIGHATAQLPAPWRPQEIRIRADKLPRTATLKVSRAKLRAELEAVDAGRAAAPSEERVVPDSGRWLVEALARAGGREPSEVGPGTRLGEDLPVDSLAWMDLVAEIERRRGHAPPAEELMAMATVGDIVEAVVGKARTKAARVPLFYGPDGRPTEAQPAHTGYPLPRLAEGVRELAQVAGRRGHAAATGALLDVEVTGDAYIPEDRPVLVIANHCSHLDSGVLRRALGKFGEDLPLLAAQDYFFGTPAKNLIFGDLLDLVPADRSGSGIGGVRNALRILESGRSLGIFPEGTRSRDGALLEFKPGAVLVALQAGVDILPVHIEGTHDAYPVGASFPKPGARVHVRIGRPIPFAWIQRRVRAESASMQEVADQLRLSVQALGRGQDSLSPWADAAVGDSA